MAEKNGAIKIAVAVVALGAAGFIAWKNSGGEPRLKTENEVLSEFKCDACGNEFVVTLAEAVAAGTRNEQPTCTKCGKATTHEIFRCPHCHASFEPVGHGKYPKNCPSCKKPI